MNYLKHLTLALVIIFGFSAMAFCEEKPPESKPRIEIVGRVNKPVTLTLEQLQKMDQVAEKEFVEFGSHHGYIGAYSIKGVSFRKIIDEVCEGLSTGKTDSIVFVFVSADGYNAVFSYGEIYDNYSQGSGILIGTEMNGEPLDVARYGHFRSFVTTDKYAGRAVKWLQKIVVKFALDDPDYESQGAD
ncbi:MAG TPA: molybdopterin-dependent oxidoreductase [bacterium]|nr:molybdopterin-dependent oxidoreductase [bacterium]